MLLSVSVRGVSHVCLGVLLMALAPSLSPVFAQEPAVAKGRTITGTVQNQDLRRVPQASVEVKDQEGTVVGAAATTTAVNGTAVGATTMVATVAIGTMAVDAATTIGMAGAAVAATSPATIGVVAVTMAAAIAIATIAGTRTTSTGLARATPIGAASATATISTVAIR